MPATVEREFDQLNAQHRWQPLYLEIRNESHDYPHRVAKFPENRNRNRYRDVSCVKLQTTENGYINASLVDMEELCLNTGSLPNTCCHFWLMVWQQKSKAVVMLNRVVEKESATWAQYWPTDDREMVFKETRFRVKLLSEDVKSYYTVHLLQLENINSDETRTMSPFYYTTWPDFGVPESPALFLNFLFKVRESGSLDPDHGPVVVHCIAGIGHSGTFSLVDTCLVLVEKGNDINIKQVLLNILSYMAIIEGAKCIKGDSNIQKHRVMTEKYSGNRIGPEEEQLCTGLSSKTQDPVEGSNESVVQKHIREGRKAAMVQKVQQMKQRLNETEQKRKRWLYWQPVLTNIRVMSVIVVGALVSWTPFFQQYVLSRR
uniref:Tyrosine-protein phosphatase non-receptor type n=1 Tax=Chinchilla lanigera TaxID=34839 RepID=A0A8C2URL6_CHILA